MSESSKTADALLLIATGCAHCPRMLAALAELVKEGRIGRLEVINIVERPAAAQTLGVRSVPWLRLGDYEFVGLQSEAELRRWADQAAAGDAGDTEYLSHLLKEGQLERVVEWVRADSRRLPGLAGRLGDADTPLSVRIGIGALMEDLADAEAGRAAQPELLALLQHADARVRADAAHFLGLVGDHQALAPLALLAKDPDPEVREVVQEAREALRNGIEPD